MDAAQSPPLVIPPPTPPPSLPAPAPVHTWPHAVRTSLLVMLIAALIGLLTHSLLHGSVQRPVAHAGEPPLTRIDLNFATRAELRLLPGVGDSLAQRIEAYRILYGPYPNIDELRKVPGIGPLTIERLRPWLIVNAPPRTVAVDQATVETSKPVKIEMPRSSKKLDGLAEPIDVNTASADELRKLPGIGPKLSQRIIDTRTQALFKTVDELRRVPGIGPKTLANLRQHVTVGAGAVAAR